MKRNLLLGLDAFGTLFRLQQPIERQYGDVARQQFGLLQDVDDAQLRAAFVAAFRAQSAAHPNYGRTSGMGATAWWTQVVHETFRPLVGRDGVPPGLAPQLLARFATREGYAMNPALPRLLRDLKTRAARHDDRRAVVVGVITNSDDRVPGILASFGLRVRPLRYSVSAPAAAEAAPRIPASTDLPAWAAYDVDFHCMSYDAGVQKPDPAIFRAAESLLPAAAAAAAVDLADWDKVYVGDETAKDIAGARAAGWQPVLVTEGHAEAPSTPGEQGRLLRLEDQRPQPLGRLAAAAAADTADAAVLSVDSVASLLQWMLRAETEQGEPAEADAA